MTASTAYTVKPYYKDKSNKSFIYANDYSFTTDSGYTIVDRPGGYVWPFTRSYPICHWYTREDATASFGHGDVNFTYGWDICSFDANGNQTIRTTGSSTGWTLEYEINGSVYSTYGQGRKDVLGVKISLLAGTLDVWRIPQLSADGSLVTMKYYVRNVSGSRLSSFKFGTSAWLAVEAVNYDGPELYAEKTDYGVLVQNLVYKNGKWVKSTPVYALALNEGYCDTPVDVICIGGGQDIYSYNYSSKSYPNLYKLFENSTNQTYSSVGTGWSGAVVGYSWKNISLASGNMREFSVSSGASTDDEVLTQAITNLSGTTLKNNEEDDFVGKTVHIKNTYTGSDNDHWVVVKEDKSTQGQATVGVKKGGTVKIGQNEYLAGDNGATILVTSDKSTLIDGAIQIINQDNFIKIGNKTVRNDGNTTITVVADANGGYFIIPTNGAVTVGDETYKNNGTKDIIGTLGDGKTTLSVPNNGSVTIGNEKYNAGKNGATIVDDDDNDGVKLANGSVWLDIGQSIILGTQSVKNNYNDTLNVTGTEKGGYFTIPANSSVVLGDTPISATGDTKVIIDGTTTTFTVPAGKKITINCKEIVGNTNSETEILLSSDGEISFAVNKGCSATIDGKVITAQDSDIPVVMDDNVLTVTIPAGKTATVAGESYKNAKNDGDAVIKVSGTAPAVVRKLVTGSVELKPNGTIQVCTSATTVENTGTSTIVVNSKNGGAECTSSVPYQGTFKADSVVVKNTSVKNEKDVTFEMNESGIVSANGLLNEQIVEIDGVEYKGLNLSAVATGNIETGYTATVTVPMDVNKKPFKVYSIYINGTKASFTVPNTTGGTFSNGVNGADSVKTITTTSTLTSVQYTTNTDATMEEVKADLSAITYKGAGTITITAAQYQAADGDVYYNGHYYRLSGSYVSWVKAMNNSFGDKDSYPGYVGHPITVTSAGENKMLITLRDRITNTKFQRIWLGAVPKGATKIINDLPDVGCTTANADQTGTAWKWIWNTPEAGKTLPDGADYWHDTEPNGSTDTPSYVIYIGYGGPLWDDLWKNNATQDEYLSYYVIEYSPCEAIQNGNTIDYNWVYDSDGNSATSGFSNVQSVSRAYSTDNIGKLSDGQSLDGYSGKKIENPSNSQNDIITVVSGRTNKTDTATVSKTNGEIIIGGKGYTTAEANTTVVVTSDGTITLTAGAVVLNPGETIKVGNKTIVNDGNTDITVNASGVVTILAGGSANIDGKQVISGDSNNTQVAIADDSLTAIISANGGKVTIGGTEYTTASANTQIKLTIDGESLVNNLVSGSVLLDKGETIKSNGKTIANYDDEIVTVSASDGVTILEGGSAMIDDEQVISGDSNKTQVTIGTDSLTATVSAKGGKVTIGGTEYTTASANTQIKLTTDGESLINNLVSGSVLLDKGETIKSNGKTIANYDDEIVTVSASDGVTILEGGSAIIDGKNQIISNTKATNVAVQDGIVVTVSGSGEAVVNGKTIASGAGNDTTVAIEDAGLIVTMSNSYDIATINGTEYTANADDTQITVTENGNSLTNGAVILDQDETVNVGTQNINVKATATQQQIIVTKKGDGTYWATVQVNGSFSAGNNKFKNIDYNTVEVEIGADGMLILPEGILGEVSGKIQDTKTNTDGTIKTTIVELPTDKEYIYSGADRQIQDVQKGDTVVINGFAKTMGEGGIIYLDGEENTKVTNSDDAITVRPIGNDAVIYVKNPSGGSEPYGELPVLIPTGNGGTTTITQNGVTVGEGGGSVTVGTDDDKTTYTAGKDGATFTFDEDGKLTLTDGSATVTNGGSIDTNVGGKDVTVTTGEGTGTTTVTTDEESGKGSVSVSNGGNVTISDGDNSTTYTAGESGATFTIDEDGKTQLSGGSAVVTNGGSIDTNVGGTTVTVKTSEDADGTTTTTTTTVTTDKESGTGTVSVDGKSEVKIGDGTYTTGENGAEFTIDENGNGSLTGGSVDVTKGQSINVGDGKTTITNNNEDATTITINEDSTGTLTIPSDGSITIGNGENATKITGDANKDTTVTIGTDGKATITLATDEAVTVGEKEISGDGDTTVKVANDGTTTVTTTESGKTVIIGDDDYTTTENNTTIQVTDSGNELVSGGVTLDNGGTINTNGTTITSGTNGTTVSVEENGDGSSTSTITMTENGGTVTVGSGENKKTITSDGDTTVKVANDGTTTVTATESGKKVIIGDGNGNDKTYTTTAENTQIQVTDNGNELVSGGVTLNNGGTINTNGTTITSGTDGTTVSVDKDEDGSSTSTITMTEQGGTVTVGSGENKKMITSDGDTTVKVANDGTTTVTTTESGKKVIIGDGNGNDKTYTTTAENTQIQVTDDGNELVSGGVTLDNGGTINTNGTTITSGTDGTTVSVEENEDGTTTSTITMTEQGGTVTVGSGENKKTITSDGDTTVKVANDGTTTVTTTESGKTVIIGDDDYTTTENNTTIQVTDSGNELVSGGVTLDNTDTIKTNGKIITNITEDKTVDVKVTEDELGNEKSVITISEGGSIQVGDTVISGSSDAKTPVIIDENGNTTVTIPAGGEIQINDKTVSGDEGTKVIIDQFGNVTVTNDSGKKIKVGKDAYEITDENTQIQVTSDGNTLVKGGVKVNDGSTIICNDGTIIKKPADSSGEVVVNIAENGDKKVTVDGNGSVEIGNATYTSGTDGTTLVIDKDGVQVKNGSVTVDGDAKVKVGDASVNSKGGTGTVTISGNTDGNGGNVIINGEGSVEINGKTITGTSENESVNVTISQDGKATLDVDSGKTVAVDGTTLSGGKFTIDDDGITVGDGATITSGGTTIKGVDSTDENSKDTKVEIGTDGITLIEGKGEITGGSVSVSNGDKNIEVTVPNGKTYTIDADNGKVDGLKSGNSVSINGVIYTYGGEDSNGGFSINDTTLSNGDTADVPRGTDASVSISDKANIVVSGENKNSTKIEKTTDGANVKVGTDDEFTVSGKTYKAGSGGATFGVDDNGKVTLTDGTVKIEESNKSVSIGNSTYTTGKTGASITSDGKLTDGSVTFDNGSKVTIGDNDVIIENTGTGTISVDSDGTITATDGGKVKIGDGENGTTYTAKSAETIIQVGDNGEVILTQGSASVPGGETITANGSTYTAGEGDRGATITSDGTLTDGSVTFGKDSKVTVGIYTITNAGEGDGTISVDSDGTITANGNGTIKVGENEYAVTDGTTISTDKDGKITIKDGSAKISNGSVITGNSGKEITSTDGSNVTVTTNTDDNTDTITVTGTDKQVIIGETTYTSKDESTTITVDKDGNVTLTGGKASVPGGNTITTTDGDNTSTYTTGGNGATITSDGTLTEGSVTFDKDSKVTVGNNTITNTGTGTISVDSDGTITANGNGTIKVGENEYAVTDGTIISTDDSGKITITNGSVEITNGESVKGNSGKEITSTDGSNVTVTTTKDGTTDIITVTGSDGKVKIGNDEYQVSDGTVITIDQDGNVTINEGSVEISDGKSVTGNSGKKIESDTGSNVTVTTTKDGKTDTVTIKDVGGKVTIGDGENGTTYTATSAETIIQATSNGNELTSGGVTLDNGKAINVGGTTIKSGKDGTSVTVTDNTGTLTIPSGGSVTIGDSTTTITGDATQGTTVTIGSDGTITLPNNGSVSVGGQDISGPDGTTIKVKDSMTTITTTESNGKISIGEDEYTTGNSGATFTIDQDGIGTLTGGGVTLDNGKAINVGGTTIKSGKDGTGVTVTDNTGTLTIPSGGSVTIGEGDNAKTITGNANKDTTVTIGTDGKATITLATDETVTVGEKEITSDGDTTVEVDSNGITTVTTTGSGKEVKIGNDTYTTGDNGATFTIDGNGNIQLSNGSAKVTDGGINTNIGGTTVTVKTSEDADGTTTTTTTTVTTDEKSGTGTVSVSGKSEVTIGNDTYTTGDNGAEFTIDKNGNGTLTGGSVDVTQKQSINVGEGKTTITNNGTESVTASSDGTITMTNGGTVKVGDGEDGTTITGTGDTKLTVDKNGKTTITTTSSESTVTIGDGENKKTITGAGDTTVEVASDGTTTVITTGSGKEVKIGNNTYTTGDDGATFTIDGNELVSGGVTVDNGGTINTKGTTITSGTDGTTVSVEENGDGSSTSTITMTENGGTVTIGDGEKGTTITGTGDTKLTVDKNGKTTITTTSSNETVIVGETTYKYGSNDTEIEVDNNGNVTLTKGSIQITDGSQSISVGDSTYTTGDTGATITSDGKISDGSVTLGNDSEVKVGTKNVVVKNTGTGTISVDSDGNVTVSDGGQVEIGEKTYTSASDNTVIEVSDSGKITLKNGSAKIPNDSVITGNSGKNIKNPTGSNIIVTTNTDDNTDTITVTDNGGKVNIGGTTYTSQSNDTVITVDNNDKVTLTKGSVQINDDRKSISVGDNTYTTGKTGATITSDGKLTDGSVAFDKDSKVTVGNNTITNTGTGTISVDSDGKVSVTNGGKVDIDETTYTSQSDDTVITIDDDDKVTLTGGKASVPGGKEIKAGNNTYTTGKTGATITSDGKLTDGSVAFDKDSKVTVGNNTITNTGTGTISVDKDGNVAVTNGGKVNIDETTYTSQSNDTVITVDGDGKVTLTGGKASVPGGGEIKAGNSTYTTGGNGATITSDGKLTDGSVTFDKDSKVTVGNNTITNTGTGTISVDSDGKVSVTNGGKVDIDQTTYTSKDESTTITVDKDGKVTLTGGKASVPGGKTITTTDGDNTNTNTYTTGGNGATITSDGKLTDGSVTFGKDSKVTIGDNDVVIKNNGDDNSVVSVDKDGKISVSNGGKVVIGGKQYVSAGNDGTKFEIDDDGNVKITNGATTTSDGKTQIAKDGSVVGGTGTTVQNTSDANNPITVVSKNNNDYVTVSSGGTVKIGDKEYDTGDKDTTYVIEEGSSVPNIIVSDDSGNNANRELVVTKQEEVPEEIQSNVKRDEVTSAIYDVTLFENGVSVQPDGTLTIRLLIPEIGKDRTFRIVHLHDNTVMNIEYTIDGDYAVFTIDKLSEFTFVVDNSASLWWLILILAIITAIEITLIIIKKWNNKKNNKMLSLALVGGVIPIYEIVLLVVFGIAVVALGVYVAYLYLPRGKLVMSADGVKADGVNAVESAEKTKSANVSLGESATLDDISVPVGVKFNRSFTAKLILSEDVTKGYFVEIANYILSYKKTRCRIGWKNASFGYVRNTISKLAIRGKNLWLYLALDPQEYMATKYHGEDCSGNRRYQKVPYAVKIKSERGLKFAKELVDILMAKYDAVRGKEGNIYTIADFPYDTQSNLIKRGLIKVYSDKEITDDSELVSAKFDIHSKVSVSDAKKFLNDTEAKSLVITTESNTERQVRGKGGFGVNIDTLSHNFSAGDTVTLSLLKEKGIVPKKEKTLKILARGVLDKPLTIIADNYSADAVKMIVLTGGKAIIGNK